MMSLIKIIFITVLSSLLMSTASADAQSDYEKERDERAKREKQEIDKIKTVPKFIKEQQKEKADQWKEYDKLTGGKHDPGKQSLVELGDNSIDYGVKIHLYNLFNGSFFQQVLVGS